MLFSFFLSARPVLIALTLNIKRLRLDLLFLMHAQPSERAENKMRQNDPPCVVADIEKVKEKLSVGAAEPGGGKILLAQQS